MSKAEERALEAYPKDIEEYVDVNGMKSVVDNNSWQRAIFLKGYHQAEKDLALTWNDMFTIFGLVNEVLDDFADGKTKKEVGEEILKRFKDFKQRKEK